MYIQPNTEIRLLTNVPLDNTYEHTIWFKNYRDSSPSTKSTSIALSFQANYFIGKTKYTLQQNSYQRVHDGVMRVNKSADSCYDCNYMMFKNINHNNKWFYAFITQVRYINELTCEITYEIDVMQTYMYDYNLGQCFIDREHTKDDTVGANTYPENLEQGEYMVTNTPSFRYLGTVDYHQNYLKRFRLVFPCTFKYNWDRTITDNKAQVVNGVYSNLYYNSFFVTTETSETFEYYKGKIEDFVSDAIASNKWDGILGCYIVPDYFSPSETYTNFGNEVGDEEVNDVPKQQSIIGDNYTPKNKKLLCYPYNILHLYSDYGSADFRYEFFTGNKCDFKVITTVVPNPVMNCYPTNYANYGNNSGANQEVSLITKDYPQVSWDGDTYKIWYAQNGVVNDIGIGGAVLQGVVGGVGLAIGAGAAGMAGATAGATMTQSMPFLSASSVNSKIASSSASAKENYLIQNSGGLIGSITSIAQNFARIQEIKTRPASVNGKQTSLSDYAFDKKHFFWANLSIRNEYAKKIDDFFTKFGYKTMELKTPNIDNRKYWWYTKTLGCEIHEAKMPNDDLSLVASIYDKGITFWKWNETEGVDIANYNKNNSIINA